jgi:glycerol-3-phosphate acyltransferase PlsY
VSSREILIGVALVVVGYVVGSLSPSVFLGKIFTGMDVREHGSGNAGTTNAFRVLGWRLGVTVFVLDVVKGVAPVVLAKYLSTPLVTVLVAFACIMGHNYSLFLHGRGGKGVATGAGAAIGLMPLPMACLFGLFGLLVVTTRIVSIASITCTVALPVMAGLLYASTGSFHVPLEYVIVCCLMSSVALWAHRENLKRLLRGEERRITLPWSKKRPGSTTPLLPEDRGDSA